MCPSLVRCILTFLLALLCFACQPAAVSATIVVKPLYEIVPNCSLDCITTFIHSDYPRNVCSRRSDINCLCKTNSTSGFTLGEAALRCVFSFCRNDIESSLGVYDICSTVDGALPRTHSTITATIVPFALTGTTSQKSGLGYTTTAHHATTTGDNATSIASSHSQSLPTTSVTKSDHLTLFSSPTMSSGGASVTKSSHSTSVNSPTTTPADATHSPGSSHTLDSGAVIGISSASGIAFCFILGVIFFFCCRRLRGKWGKKNRPDFFEIGGFMSEPPGFDLPPKRPTQEPMPYPGAPKSSQEGQLMFFPFNNPPSLTRPNHGSSAVRNDPAQIGIAISSNSELETPPTTQASQRTLSELLPDKPELCPEPLRLSRRTHSRPDSEQTLFEEDALARNRRSTLGSANSWTDSSGSTLKDPGNRPYDRMRMVGLPPNPRVLMQGFGGAGCGLPNRAFPGQPMHPSPVNGRDIRPDLGATECWDPSASISQANWPGGQDYIGSTSWQHWDSATFGNGPNQTLMSNAASRSPNPNSEPVEIDSGLGGQGGCTRNIGCLRPLTPVREIGTPANNATGETNRHYFNNNLPGTNFPAGSNPNSDAVSRPRIVRQDDIRRVEIQRGRPQPRELMVPYSPDDYWREHRRAYRTPGITENMPWRRPCNGVDLREERRVLNAGRPQPPVEHNLTPSRRGTDLILRVD